MSAEAPSNPFQLTGYHGPEYFCDREKECAAIHRAAASGVNISLVSLRRMGKTALMRHIVHQRRMRSQPTILIDLQPTSSVAGLVEALAIAIVEDLYTIRHKVTTAVRDFVSRIGATVNIGPDGTPSVDLMLSTKASTPERPLRLLLSELESWKKPVLVVMDEFQQIDQYRERNVEAILRAHIQPLVRTRFVFSGSQRGMLDSMFLDHGRPFYASTEHLYLGPISKESYASFIKTWYAKKRRSITAEAIDELYSECIGRTFHMQQIMNKIWDEGLTRVSAADVRRVIGHIHREQEYLYYKFRSLLTASQWKVLQAIAFDGTVKEPYSNQFRERHHLPAASTIKRALTAIVDRELVAYAEGQYFVEDPLLASWIRSTFRRS